MARVTESARRKLDWADRRCDQFLSQLESWIQDNYSTFFAPVPSTWDHAAGNLRFEFASSYDFSVPVDWGYKFGELVASLRSALDYLAWSLVQNGAAPIDDLADSRARNVWFPVIEGPKAGSTQSVEDIFASQAARRLPGVGQQHLAVIRKYQPFVADTHQGLDVISRLVRVNNADKHRSVTILGLGTFGLWLARNPDGTLAGLSDVLNFRPNDEFSIEGKVIGPAGIVAIGSIVVTAAGEQIGDEDPSANYTPVVSDFRISVGDVQDDMCKFLSDASHLLHAILDDIDAADGHDVAQ